MKSRYYLAALALGLISCGGNDNMKNTLYQSEAYTVYSDSVVQGEYRAVAVSDDKLTSDYQSPANATYSRHIEFKLSINGKDNELPVGVNHHLLLYPENGQVNPETIVFGQPDKSIPQTPENDFLEPNTELNLKVDLRHVLKDFKEKGYHVFHNGDKMMASDFRGVYIAGGSEPLSWDFENLPSRKHLELKDEDGDGIYTISLTMNVFNPDNYTDQEWTLSKDIQQYPQYESEQQLVNTLYNLSLEEMLLDVREDSTFMAGAKWNGVWTRDISYSILLSLAALEPEIAKASLMKKVKNGRIIQDTGTGGSWPVSTDRMTWTLAAWEVYRVTGDQQWLETIYPIIKNSAEDDLKTIFYPETGLMKGESSFLDWRKQSYPLWMGPVDIYNSQNLGTNAVHFRTYEILALMSELLKEDGTKYERIAFAIKDGLNENLWLDEKGYYGQFLYGRDFYTASQRSEALGEALTVLFEIAGPNRRQSIVKNTPLTTYGVPCIYPQIPNIPPYHNNGIWPFVQAYWNWAAAKTGNTAAVEQGLAALYRQAALFVTNKENFVAQNGDYKGTEVNSDRQLWSVAGNLAMIYRVFYGMDFTIDGLKFKPFVPKSYRGVKKLSGFKYRDAILNITLRGYGRNIKHFTINGKPVHNDIIPADMEGPQEVIIELDNGKTKPGAINLLSNQFSPESPRVVLENNQLSWKEVKGAEKYLIYKNAKLVEETTDTKFEIEPSATYSNFQLSAVDANGWESFLSEPLSQTPAQAVITAEAEKAAPASELPLGNYSGEGFIELSKTENLAVTFEVEVIEEGEYVLDFRYSNGSGPINTDNKCAIRSLFVNEQYLGPVVLPQLGFEEWSNWGFSNGVRTKLKAGQQEIKLSYLPHNENMNGLINRAMLDQLRLRKVSPETEVLAAEVE